MALLNPSKYSNWSRELWADRDCVLAAVQANGQALANAVIHLRADRDVVLAAITQNGIALKYARDELRADREVVLTAVQQEGLALYYASEALRADREIVLAAVQQDGRALKYASDDLHADHDVVLAAAQENGDALLHASKSMRADREVVLAAVQQNVWALRFADEALRQDEQFVDELADVCSRGYIWFYEPQLSLEGTARKAMRSEKGLLLLAEQARVSLLGEPAIMKELLLSAVEHGCLKDALKTLIASQKEDILNALRTVMAWYSVGLPEALPTDMNGLNALCNLICTALCEKGGGSENS